MKHHFLRFAFICFPAVLFISSCQVEDLLTSLDLTQLNYVFVIPAEKASLARTGTGGNLNGGRSNTSHCCPSIQLLNASSASDLNRVRPEDAFIDNPFGQEIDTDPTEPIVIELIDSDQNSFGSFSLQVAEGEGIGINLLTFLPGEYTIEISVGGQQASASFTI